RVVPCTDMLLRVFGGLCPFRPRVSSGAPASEPGVATCCVRLERAWLTCAPSSALALLVPWVLADHHDPAVAPDNPALVADLFDARLDLHRYALLLMRARREGRTSRHL